MDPSLAVGGRAREWRPPREGFYLTAGRSAQGRCDPCYRCALADGRRVYLVVSGRPRLRVGDETVELGPFDAVRVGPGVVRCLEGGPEGAEVVAFGAPNTHNRDVEVLPGWWGD